MYEQPFTSLEIQLEKNDKVYMFSDGYGDQIGGAKATKFMLRRLKEVLLNIHHLPMHEQESKLRQALNDWMGDRIGQIDDILVAGFVV